MTSARRDPAPPLFFAALAFLLHAPGLTAPAYLDDGPYVFGSPFLRAPAEVFWTLLFTPDYFAATAERSWQPLVTVLNRFLVDAPFAPRALSAALHALCAWLVFLLAQDLFRSRRAALFAGALFAAFPLAAEPVFFAVFKGHLLAAAAALAALLAWRKGRRDLSVAALAVGLLAKESALVIGPLLFLHAVLLERRRAAAALKLLVPHAALAALYLLARFVYLDQPPPMLVPAEPRPLAALAWYLGALIWPPAPGFFRALPEGDAWVLLLLAPYAAALWNWRREPRRLFFLLWLPAALLPVLHLVPFAAKSPVADRYLYLAAAGFCLALGRLADGRARAAFAALVLLWGWGALKRSLLYRDPDAFAAAAVEAAPDSAAARLFHAQSLFAAGDAEGALRAAEAAARLEPRDPENWTWLGLARHSAKQADAEAAFRRALDLQETPQARANLGALYEETGRPELALKEYARASELAPEWEKPRRLAAELKARQKKGRRKR